MSFTHATDISSFYSRSAGLVPHHPTASPRGLSNTPPPPHGQSHSFDRLLQRVKPAITADSPLTPPPNGRTGSSAAAHQTLGQDFKGIQTGLLTTQEQGETNNEHAKFNTAQHASEPRARSHNERTAGLSFDAASQFERTAEHGQRDQTHGGESAAKDGGFSFWDIVDMVNPLQHIPIVSTIYRSVTGDTINTVARVAGGALYGGPIGAAAGFANAAVDHATGKDIGENILALVMPDKADTSAIALAQNNSSESNISHITKDEIVWAGLRIDAQHSPSPPKTSARSIETDGARQNFQPTASLTQHSYPMHKDAVDGPNRTIAPHSLHTSQSHDFNGAPPQSSNASFNGAQIQKESLNTGYKHDVGSPVFLSLQEASADHTESNVTPKPIAHDIPHHDLALKMQAALDKYQSLKLDQIHAMPR